MRYLAAIALAAAASANANTLTFDSGTMTTIDGVSGWLEDGVFVTGNFSLGDVNGDGSNEITVSHAMGDIVFTVLGSSAVGYGFGMDYVGNPASDGGFVHYWGATTPWTRSEGVLFGQPSGGMQPVVSDVNALGPLVFGGAAMHWTQELMWKPLIEPDPTFPWHVGGTMSADNLVLTEVAELPPIPEPATVALLLAGMGVLVLRRRQ
jgi:hypothetical protein